MVKAKQITTIHKMFLDKCREKIGYAFTNEIATQFVGDLMVNFRETEDVHKFIKDWCWGEVQFADDELFRTCTKYLDELGDIGKIFDETAFSLRDTLKRELANVFERQIMQNQNAINYRLIAYMLSDYSFECSDLDTIDEYLDEYLDDWFDHIDIFDKATPPEDNYKKVKDFMCDIAYECDVKMYFLETDAEAVIQTLTNRMMSSKEFLAAPNIAKIIIIDKMMHLSVDDFELVKNPANGKKKLVLVNNIETYLELGLDVDRYRMPEEHKAEQKKSADRGR